MTVVMRALRPLLVGVLVLAFVFGSLPIAAARAQARGVERIEICSSEGSGTIFVDAQGRPVAPPHPHCPDCLPALFDAADAPPLGFCPVSHPAHPAIALNVPGSVRPAAGPQARAPPVAV